MPEYLAPAVYVTEIPFAAHPIEGVATSTAGLLGAGAADRANALAWTDQNQHDPGTTVLELSASVTESLAYRSDLLSVHPVARFAQSPAGTSSEVQPNREFPDLWLRFVSSVSEFERQSQASQFEAGAPGTEIDRADLSRVVSKYIGETEKNLDAVIGRAEQSGAALLFEEADALFGKRTDVRDSHDRYANQEASPLLQQIEGHEGTATVTTNASDNIDPDVFKRLRAEVALPVPPRT